MLGREYDKKKMSVHVQHGCNHDRPSCLVHISNSVSFICIHKTYFYIFLYVLYIEHMLYLFIYTYALLIYKHMLYIYIVQGWLTAGGGTHGWKGSTVLRYYFGAILIILFISPGQEISQTWLG